MLPPFTGDAQNVSLQLAMLGAVNVSAEVILHGGLGMCAGVFHSRFSRGRKAQAVLNMAGTVYAGLAVVIVVEMVMGRVRAVADDKVVRQCLGV